MSNVSNVPAYRGGQPALAVFLCKRCGDGIVANAEPAPGERLHRCKPWSGSHPGDELNDVMFRALLDLPATVKAH